MELEKRMIHKNKTPLRASGQIVAEEDYNLPEYKPDILSIIKSRGNVLLDEIVPEENHVMVQGKLHFEVLYQGEGEHPVFDCMKGTIPFRDRIAMEGVTPGENVVANICVEDMGVVVINSRKLSLRGLMDVNLSCAGAEEMELPMVPSFEDDIQIRQEEKTLLKLMEQKRDRMRLRQEITLPKDKENIHSILWQDVHLEQINLRQSAGEIEVSGILYIFALYVSEQGELVWYETTVPVIEQVACNIPEPQGFYQLKTISTQTSMEPREDLDGELRNLMVECFVELEMITWQEESVELLQDAYGISNELHVHCHKEDLWQLAMKNDALLNFESEWKLPETKEALYLCNSHGEVKLLETKTVTGGISVTGVCYVEVLYLATDERTPIACSKHEVPFTGEIEAGAVREGDYIDVEVSLHRMQCSLVDSSSLLCRGEVSLQLIAFHKEELLLPDDLIEEPLDLEELNRQPGMIGYVVKEKDCIWDIAKKYHTTKKELMETNDLASEELAVGQKLLIMKHIYL